MSNLVVRTNLLAINSHRNLGMVSNQQQRASQRLSSGFRINTGSDDAAGLAISEGMRAQIRGMNQASRNSQDAISLIQTADGYLDTASQMANRIRELNVQGANDTYNQDQRNMMAEEIMNIANELQRIGEQATFNQRYILRTTDPEQSIVGMQFQVGPDTDHRVSIDIDLGTPPMRLAYTVTPPDDPN